MDLVSKLHPNDFSWKSLLALPVNLVSFCLVLTFDILPSPRNIVISGDGKSQLMLHVHFVEMMFALLLVF